jgi:hypothetical protein
LARAAFDHLSYNDLNYRSLPFKAHVSLSADDVGKAVTLTSDYEVGLGSNGDPLIGRLEYIDAGTVYCTVGIGDTLIFDGVSGALPAEKNCVVVNGAGAVRVATSVDAGYPSDKVVLGVDSSTRKVVVLF